MVIAFVVLRPGDERKTATTATSTIASGTNAASTTTKTTKSQPASDLGPLLTGNSVVAINVRQGDTVRFRVRSAVDEEAHIHGYDIAKDLPAGETVPVAFKATIPGIFEIEFEKSAKQIAKLTVEQ